jgi:hypothetical protein
MCQPRPRNTSLSETTDTFKTRSQTILMCDVFYLLGYLWVYCYFKSSRKYIYKWVCCYRRRTNKHTNTQDMMMTQEDYDWLVPQERILFTSTRLKPEQIQMIYDIHNRITTENKRPNNCGSCLRNTMRIVKHNYLLKKNQQ